jgi:bifunctional UDP-N-acetylglucosamine pyrophosphorylase/glucosamine-1-phosphate N-acetyltransferase
MSRTKDPPLEVIVLAAGKGTRMRSDTPKVLHELGGEPLLAHVLRAVKQLEPHAVHVVLGYGAQRVRDRFADENVNWVVQREQLGTGHAVKTALPGTAAGSTVLVVYGDIPMIGGDELSDLAESLAASDVALLTADFKDPRGYGRILRDTSGKVVGIVEDKDASPEQQAIREINTGFIAARSDRLAEWLEEVDDDNSQREHYLTDVIAIAVREGRRVADFRAACPEAVIGVNTNTELACLERQYRKRRAAELLEQGVTLVDPDRFDARGEISFGRDCIVDVNVLLEGPLEIGDGVRIGPHSVVRRSDLGDGVNIRSHCVIEDSRVGKGAVIGPFARLRPGTLLAGGVHVGNFVEIKNSELGEGAKVNHLSYVGDSTLGRRVNIGAGVITCNYDGANKNHTQIEDDVFVGSNCQLVAPVKLGKGATIGAGSTITKDVPADALAITRARQKHFSGWERPRKDKD